MSAQLKLGMKLAQKLQMTPQLQQSIRLLTLPLMEVEQVVRDELTENPVLEEVHDTVEEQNREELANKEELPEHHTWMEFTSTSSVYSGARSTYVKSSSGVFNLENVVSAERSLYDHLTWQVQMSHFNNNKKAYLNLLIDNLNEDGYLKNSLENITKESRVDFTELKEALALLHTLDPGGVGARNLKECLLIQARQNQEDTKDLVQLITNHLDDLEVKDFKSIGKKMNLDEEEVMDLHKIIMAMEPKPGRRFATQPVHYITPDVYILKEGDNFRVAVNEEGLPNIRITHLYQEMLRNLGDNRSSIEDSTQKYIRHKMNSALWLIRSVHQRQKTLFKVTSSIVKHQKSFFQQGVEGMKTLVLKQIAEDVGVHESTVSRITTNKYAHTPHGVYELKYFFNVGFDTVKGGKVSSEIVKLKIKDYIEKENKIKPLSDQKIMDKLGEDLGLIVSRKTIIKYRSILNVGAPADRRIAK